MQMWTILVMTFVAAAVAAQSWVEREAAFAIGRAHLAEADAVATRYADCTEMVVAVVAPVLVVLVAPVAYRNQEQKVDAEPRLRIEPAPCMIDVEPNADCTPPHPNIYAVLVSPMDSVPNRHTFSTQMKVAVVVVGEVYRWEKGMISWKEQKAASRH